jgi:hypothetical protein
VARQPRRSGEVELALVAATIAVDEVYLGADALPDG